MEKLIDKDVYWGEFPESEMDKVLSMAEGGRFEEASDYIDKKLNRKSFIFGRSRSDFQYYLDLNKSSKVLDCGAGLGIHSFNAARRAAEVHSFDLSSKRLRFIDARAKHEGVNNIFTYHSDFRSLPFKENTFDAIFMNGVLEWVGEDREHEDPREMQIKVLKQLRSLLKPGGTLYVGIENRVALAYLKGYDHNGLRFTNYMPRFLANIVTKIFKGHDYRTYTYSKRGYESLFRDAGFDQNKTDYYIAHPGYNLPQYIVPFDSPASLKFFLSSFSTHKGIKGGVARLLSSSSLGLKLMRHLFYAYLIYAKK